MPEEKEKFKLKPAKKKVRRLPPVREPREIEKEYRVALETLTKKIQKDIQEQIIPIFDRKAVLADSAGQILVTDGVDDILQIYTEQISGLRDKYDGMKQEFKETAKKFGTGMGSITKRRFYNTLKNTMGGQTDMVEIMGEKGVQAQVMAGVESNVQLIKSIPDLYFDKVQKLVQENFVYGSKKEGGLMADLMPMLRKEIRELGPKAKKRAKLIARDQTSKLNSVLAKARQTNLGVEEYIWHNSKDRRVRGNPGGLYPDVPRDKNHWIREGKVFRWDKPPKDGHPGEAINCRCYAEAVIKLDGVSTTEVEREFEDGYTKKEKRLIKRLKEGKITTARYNQLMRRA